MSEEHALELAETLRATCEAIAGRASLASPELSQSWQVSLQVVSDFDPVPRFVRRLSKIVFSGRQNALNKVPEGAVLGLSKLLCASASDSVIGTGDAVVDARQAISILRGDVFAAVVAMHSVSKRILAKNFQKGWMTIFDQALVRAQIGYWVGSYNESYGPGRGMLAGFASRVGLCILMSRGTQGEGNRILEMLMMNPNVTEVGLEVYGCSPLHIGAFLLSLVGCGGNASIGFVNASLDDGFESDNVDQQMWLETLNAIEALRSGNLDLLNEDQWALIGLGSRDNRLELEGIAHVLRRRGHQWGWMLA